MNGVTVYWPATGKATESVKGDTMKDGRKRVIRFMTWAAVLCGLFPWTVSPAHALLEWEEMAIPNSGVTCTFNAAMAFKGYLYLGESPGVRVFRTEDG